MNFNVPDEQPALSAEIFDLNAGHWIETNLVMQYQNGNFLRFSNNIVKRFVGLLNVDEILKLQQVENDMHCFKY